MLVYYPKEWKRSTNSWRPGVKACLLTQEKFYELTRSEEVRKLISDHRQGVAGAKIQLPAAVWVGTQQEGGYRKAENMTPTQMYMVDLDHISDKCTLTPTEVWEEIQKRMRAIKESTGYDFKEMLTHITPSGDGLRMVLRCTENFPTLTEHMEWLNRQLRLSEFCKWDSAVHDLSRISFLPQFEDILFINNEIFKAPFTDFNPIINDYKDDNNVRPPKANGEAAIATKANDGDGGYRPLHSQYADYTYHGHRMVDIIARYIQVYGEPEVGERHTFYNRMVADFRNICGNNPAVLLDLLPRYDGDDATAYAGYASQCQSICRKNNNVQLPKYFYCFLRDNGFYQKADNDPLEIARTSEIPSMPAKLPKLIKLLTKNTPEQYKATVAHAVFPALATHLCGVSFRYTDNREHEATLMNCVMAGTGSGKGCIDDPIEHIMADIKRRDKENERREKEWKKECVRKGDNKDKRDRPEGLVIQMIDPDMTKPALVTRMEESEGHFVYVKLNELDLFEQLKGQTGKQHFQLMCLAFDPGAEYGQTRIGTQSVTARPRCRFNWNACTTIQKGRKFFARVLTDGPISRINFCTIPEEEIGCEQPIYGVYDAAFDEELKPYLDRLCAARGLTDCPQALRLAKRLQQEVAEFAQLSQDKVYWNLSHRACIIAWLKACVLYVANGMKWESAIDDFVRWSLQYDLWCKMQFFGEAIAKAESGDDARIGKRGPRNLLELLPDTFTLDDAKRMRRQQGMDIEDYRTEKMIRTWINRKYVIQNTEYSFQKSNNHGKTE